MGFRVIKSKSGKTVTVPRFSGSKAEKVTVKVDGETITFTPSKEQKDTVKVRRSGGGGGSVSSGGQSTTQTVTQPQGTTPAEQALNQSLPADDPRRNAPVDITSSIPGSVDPSLVMTPIPAEKPTPREVFFRQSLPRGEREQPPPSRVKQVISKQVLGSEGTLVGLAAKEAKRKQEATSPIAKTRASLSLFTIEAELGFRRRLAREPEMVALEFAVAGGVGAGFQGAKFLAPKVAKTAIGKAAVKATPGIIKSERTRKLAGPVILGAVGGVAAVDIATVQDGPFVFNRKKRDKPGIRAGEVTSSFAAIGTGFATGSAVTRKGVQVVGTTLARRSAEKSVQISDLALKRVDKAIVGKGTGKAVIGKQPVNIGIDVAEGQLKGGRFVQKQITVVRTPKDKIIGEGVSRSAGFDKGIARFRATKTTVTPVKGQAVKVRSADVTFFETINKKEIIGRSLIFSDKRFVGLGKTKTKQIGFLELEGKRAEFFTSKGVAVKPGAKIGSPIPKAKALIKRPKAPILGKKGQIAITKPKPPKTILKQTTPRITNIEFNVKSTVGQLAVRRAASKFTTGTTRLTLASNLKTQTPPRIAVGTRALNIQTPKITPRGKPITRTTPNVITTITTITTPTTRLTPSTRQTTTGVPRTPATPIFPSFTPPSPPKTLPPIVPILPLGGGIGTGKGGGILGKRTTRYTPSVTAGALQIFGKRKKGKLTGFEIRPLEVL